MFWTGLCCSDNADLSVVTLACVLLNEQYYAAEILPKQIAGALVQCQSFLYLSLLFEQERADTIWLR